MAGKDFFDKYRVGRTIETAQTGDEDLGPLKLLPGTWKNKGGFDGRGWNMIALPWIDPTDPESFLDYRLLLNQYNEELRFSLVDKGVPNRGIEKGTPDSNTDQLVVTLDYQQTIEQIAAKDSPHSGLAGPADLAIHHEPGLFLNMTNLTTNSFDVARLATIPHGDAALALGVSEVIDGPPTIPTSRGLPIGGPEDLDHPYLAPYKEFHDSPFKGLFDPVDPNALLQAMPSNVLRTTVLHLDTAEESGGIRNIPFIVKQANAASMQSIFWIMELDENDEQGNPKLVLAYTQTVLLDFFDRRDGIAGKIRWPHVSINVMHKVSEPDPETTYVPAV